MSVQKVVTANAYKKFDSATVFFAGAVPAASRVVTNAENDLMGVHSGRAGAALPAALSLATQAANAAGDAEPAAGRSRNPTHKPYSSGTYGYMAQNKYVVKGLSTTISGVANTVLLTGAADGYGRKPTYLRSGIRTSFLYAWTWTADAERGPTYSKTYHNRTPAQNDMNGQDEASVLVTRALPGELQYMYGAKTPLQANYPAKTGG